MDRSNRFKWLTEDQRQAVNNCLISPMPRGRGELVFRDAPHFLDSKTVDGKAHVVFVAYYLYPSVARKSFILRGTGKFYTTLLTCCLREDNRPSDYFDQAYEAADYQELLELLSQAAPQVISIAVHPWILGAIGIEAGKMTATRVVVDLNDSYLFIDKSADSLTCQMEREILKRCEAFTHKMPQEGISDIRSAWGIDTPDYLIHSLPLEHLFEDGLAHEPKEQARVVFAGGLIPPDIARKHGHENHLFDHLIQTMPNGHIALTIYLNQYTRDTLWNEYSQYVDQAERVPSFHFRPGVPFFELPKAISKYHYGLYYENYSASSYDKRHFQYNMATKIFSYIEAGLPILVHKKASYISRLVEEHDLGIVYDIENMEEIPELIQASDQCRLRSSICRFRNENTMFRNLPLLNEAFGLSY